MSTTISPTTDRAAWLAERRRGIGASEAPAVLGLSPFEDATTLALRKLGRLPEAEETEAMELGSLLEPVVAELYQRRTGRRIVRQQVFQRDTLDTFLFATADGIDDAGDLVEFKTTGAWTGTAKELGEDGTDELPAHWLIQAQQQIYVHDRDRCHFAVLVGGQTFRTFTVERSPRLITTMRDSLERFWDAVSRGEVPQSEATTYTPRILAALNPECSGEMTADEAFAEMVRDYEHCRAQEKEFGERADQLKIQILTALGTWQFAKLPSGQRVKRYLELTKERTQVVRAGTKHYFKILKGA